MGSSSLLKPTKEQQAIIDARQKQIVVAASAGSGKTFVLAKRVVAQLKNDVQCSIEEFLVLTFTDAAAAEMCQRIGLEIGSELKNSANGPEVRQHLQRQLLLLPLAGISTIHSFCQSLLRQYFYLIDLEPDFSVGEVGAMNLLQNESLKKVFQKRYEDGKEVFLGLLEAYCGDKADEELQKTVLTLYEYMQSFPRPEQWLEDAVRRLERRPEEVLPEEKLQACFLQSVRDVEELAVLVKDFKQAYQEMKQQKQEFDFNDLEHFCLQLLLNKEGQPSEVALELQRKYREIMVDEYQDTNGVQEAIVQALSADDTCRFMVGDVKQSIYRFRKADPEIFLQKRKECASEAEPMKRVFSLNTNYRSRACILQSVNYLFRRLMPEKSDACAQYLVYADEECLHKGYAYDCADDVPVELVIIDYSQDGEAVVEAAEEREDEGSKPELGSQACFIAREIQQLVASQYPVTDGKGTRPIEYRDIAILLRSPGNKAQVFLDALRQQGIPAFAASKGFFASLEVRTMLALLQVLDNPRQDVPLGGVLLSPLAGFAPEELALICCEKQKGESLWQPLEAYGEADNEDPLSLRVRQLLTQLRQWRRFAREQGVDKLIERVYDETAYFQYAGALPGGAQRQANLQVLHEKSRHFARRQGSLGEFVRYLESLEQSEADLEEGKYLSDTDNVVRIMSVHRSKGLEFPVVFFAAMSSGFNNADINQKLLCDKEAGLGPRVIVDSEQRFWMRPEFEDDIRKKINKENRLEELRVFYVALTRAREKLFLIGAVKKKNSYEKWCQNAGNGNGELPEKILLDYNASYLEWVGTVLAGHGDGKILREKGGLPEEKLADFPAFSHEEKACWNIRIIESSELRTANQEAAVRRELNEETACINQEAARLWQEKLARCSQSFPKSYPARTTASALKAADTAVYYGRKRGEEKILGPSPAEKGSMVHLVLQYLDLKQDLSEAGIRQQMETILKRDILLNQWFDKVDAASMARLFASDFGQSILKADQVLREVPFAYKLSADDVQMLAAGEKAQQGMLVKGVIDCLLVTDGQGILVDWKTDTGKTEEDFQRDYALQLKLYGLAVQGIMKIPVGKKYIYSLALNQEILVEDGCEAADARGILPDEAGKGLVVADSLPSSTDLEGNLVSQETCKRKSADNEEFTVEFEFGSAEFFKEELLKAKKAYITEYYNDGSRKFKDWDAQKFTPTSDLMSNIRSKTKYRPEKRKELGLRKLFISLSDPRKQDVLNLETLKEKDNLSIGRLVERSIHELLAKRLLSDEQVKFLTDKDFCKESLGINYPLLKEVEKTQPLKEQKAVNKYPRYYAKPVIIGDKSYLICKEFFETSRKSYLEWLYSLK